MLACLKGPPADAGRRHVPPDGLTGRAVHEPPIREVLQHAPALFRVGAPRFLPEKGLVGWGSIAEDRDDAEGDWVNAIRLLALGIADNGKEFGARVEAVGSVRPSLVTNSLRQGVGCIDGGVLLGRPRASGARRRQRSRNDSRACDVASPERVILKSKRWRPCKAA